MFKRENSANETPAGDYGSVDQVVDITNGGATDIATHKRTGRPKVALAVTVTCPECGFGNKPEWLNKSQRGDSYAATMFCEHCGCLMAVWAMHVDIQIVAHK